MKSDAEYEIPAKVVRISNGAFADCKNLETVKFCGELNDYASKEVVTGSSHFSVRVSSAFKDTNFFGQPTTTSLTEEECPRDATSSKSNAGVIAGCVCGVAVLAVLVVAAVWFRMSSTAKKKDIELEKVSQALNGTLSTVFFDKSYVKKYK